MTMILKYYLLLLHLTVLLSVVDCLHFIGCYRDISRTERLMNDGYKEFPGTLTKEVCSEFCKSQSAGYIGLQYGQECYCSRTRPLYPYLMNNTECSMKCDGNSGETCGDRLRLTVYDIYGRGSMRHENKYIGCFEDFFENRMLPNKFWEFPDILTPDYCLGQCWRHGYRYAGVQYGMECFCGENINENYKLDESECSTPCEGDERLKCGFGLRSNVYATGIDGATINEFSDSLNGTNDCPKDYISFSIISVNDLLLILPNNLISPTTIKNKDYHDDSFCHFSDENKRLGCFEDEYEENRLLPLQIDLTDTNSPKKCLNLCKSIGYKYSGLQYSIECFCGNQRPPATLQVGDNECSLPCPADSDATCGGNYKLLAYKTDSEEAAIKPPTSVVLSASTPSDPTEAPILSPCNKSVTTVNGKLVCKGTVVFFEEFNEPIERTKWLHSILMPWTPDFDFVFFSNKPETSFVKSGKLFIKPNLMEEGFVRRGKLSLKDCTGELFTPECERTAISYAILPPVESARISTKESFAFKYGRVDIRAKLPAGDWLYPELYLEPKRKIYGKDYASGRIQIAGARGNLNLTHQGKNIGLRYLSEGVILGTPEEVKVRSVVRYSSTPWSSDFHNYSFLWSPDNMWFMVDGQVKQALIPPGGGQLYELLSFKNGIDTWSHSKVAVAPFDQESFLTIGLSVGGIRNFPDDSLSGEHMKPWLNKGIKAMANFLQAKNDWINTWKEEDAMLQVDSVKVTAL